MKKFISILLVLVMLFSACSNVFADEELTAAKVKENVLAYYDENEATIKAALKSAAGDAAYLIDSFDIKAAVSNHLDLYGEDVRDFCVEICNSSADKDTKTQTIADYMTESLVLLFNAMFSLIFPGAGETLRANIAAFASSYAPTIVEQYKTQLNLATIVSNNPIFFVVFSLVELVVILGLLAALLKNKKAAK